MRLRHRECAPPQQLESGASLRLPLQELQPEYNVLVTSLHRCIRGLSMQLLAQREQDGISYIQVYDEAQMENFALITARLARRSSW
jgi:hypothetical protein